TSMVAYARPSAAWNSSAASRNPASRCAALPRLAERGGSASRKSSSATATGSARTLEHLGQPPQPLQEPRRRRVVERQPQPHALALTGQVRARAPREVAVLEALLLVVRHPPRGRLVDQREQRGAELLAHRGTSRRAST